MTHIAEYPTKKAFREAVAADPTRVHIYDPAIVDPLSGTVAEILSKREYVTVTNHPKRSWFAEVRRGRDGAPRVT